MLNVSVDGMADFKNKIRDAINYICHKNIFNDELLFNTEVVLSELVANVIQHSKCSANILLDVADNYLNIQVLGNECFEVENICLPESNDERGRGLFLVKQLSDEVNFLDGGKIVEVKLKF